MGENNRIGTTVLIVAFILFPNFSSIQGSPLSDNVTRILNDLMKKPYDKRVRPLLGENALFVRVSFNLDSLLGVNEPNSEISVRLTLRQSWLEPRLTFPLGAVPNDTIQLGQEQTKFLWVPDTTIENQRKLEKLEGQESTFLNSEGWITTSAKIALTVDCGLNYGYFPFDTQTCTINFLSQTRDRRDIIYEWMTEDSSIGSTAPLTSGRFQLISFDTATSTVATKQGNSIMLVLRLHLRGVWKKYLISAFLPMILFTGISLGSLWIHTPNIGILINFLNVSLINVYLVVLTRDGGPRIRDTSLGQFLTLSFLFVFASLIVHFLNFYFKNHPATSDPETGNAEERSTPLPATASEDVELGIELEDAKGSAPSEEEPRRPSDTPPAPGIPDFAAYLKKIRSGLATFAGHAHWILLLAFLVLTGLYFGIHVNTLESRVGDLLKNIRYK